MTARRMGISRRGVLTLAPVALTSASCAFLKAGVRPPSSLETEEEIRRLETRLRDAALTGAVAVLDDLLADDYTNTDAYGLVRHKAQVIADITSGNSSFEAIDLDDINVQLYGDAAVLTARRTVRGRRSGSGDPSGEFRQIRIFARRFGRWQAVMLQFTRIAGT